MVHISEESMKLVGSNYAIYTCLVTAKVRIFRMILTSFHHFYLERACIIIEKVEAGKWKMENR